MNVGGSCNGVNMPNGAGIAVGIKGALIFIFGATSFFIDFLKGTVPFGGLLRFKVSMQHFNL